MKGIETSKSVRVVIADDSIQYRRILARLLDRYPRIQVIGEAVNGIEALELIVALRPDVILMDYEMPLMDGMTALQHLMIHLPTPTIMFSRLTREGTARCFDALKNGAVDFFCKENLQDVFSDAQLSQQLADKVIAAAEMAITAVEPAFPQAPGRSSTRKGVKTLVFCEECGAKEEILVWENEDQGDVLCSTCGEYISLEQRNKYRRANCLTVIVAGEGAYVNLLRLIPNLRQDINGSLLVVIDGSVEHVDAFSQYLDAISTVNVVRIRDDLKLQGGTCYIGCDNENIFLRPYSAEYSLHRGGVLRDGECAVDNTIGSVAEVFRERAAVGFLSGRERQGESGLVRLMAGGGSIAVLAPAKCLNRQLPENIIKKFNAIIAENEDALVRIIDTMHAHYRDTIVMA